MDTNYMELNQSASSKATPSVEFSIIVPTFNERENVLPLLSLLDTALESVRWEVVFVDDDSPDKTAELVRHVSQSDARVRCVHRFGRRGLSSACIEGILATSAPFVAVMDADLQHDETRLPIMLDLVRQTDVDVVVGSRYTEGGSLGEWNESRQAMSKFATKIAALSTKTQVSDPMSGFFVIRRDAFMEAMPKLSAIGFKILLDIFASAGRPLRSREVAYQFRSRQHGESKLDTMVLWEYLLLLADKSIGHIIPIRFFSFALIGSTGVVVHFLILLLLFKFAAVSFAMSQAIATTVAISSNFFLNNLLTYRDRRLKQWRLFWGWVSFNLVCATGAAANVGVATWLFERQTLWIFSALAGIAVSVVWNYAISGIFTWKRK